MIYRRGLFADAGTRGQGEEGEANGAKTNDGVEINWLADT